MVPTPSQKLVYSSNTPSHRRMKIVFKTLVEFNRKQRGTIRYYNIHRQYAYKYMRHIAYTDM